MVNINMGFWLLFAWLPFSEAYLEPSQISTMEGFCENSQMRKTVNYFPQKSFVVDVRLGSKYVSVFVFSYTKPN